MANLLQSAQTKTTCAPSYYTNYLSNLATAGQAAQQGAQYVGAQPLQTQAFCQIGSTAGATVPMFQTAAGLLGQAAGQNVTGAATPYLQGAVGACALQQANPYLQTAAFSGGLCAASPYLQSAAGCSPAVLAQQYMNPYIQCAVQRMSDIAQRNIQQTIAPQATAATVGSGQYGSQRGAQVLGQLENQAEQCLNANIANMLSQGYGQALTAAGQRQALLGQLGSTAGSLAQQQAGLLGQLGSTAGSLEAQRAALLGNLGQTAGGLTAQQAGVLQAAGQGTACVAQKQATQNLACVNALATLGGQQQAIGQNAQLFPLSTLGTLAGLLQGYNVPTGTKTTLCMSPLSALAGVGTGIGALFCSKSGKSLFCSLKGLFGSTSGSSGGCASGSYTYNPCKCGYYCCSSGSWVAGTGASGGLVNNGSIGCASTKNRGALPGKE